MATYQTLLVDKKEGITTITLNRPEKRNAMSPQLHREMYDCLTDLKYDKETRVIVITGAGESFCAGQDLKQYFIEMDSQPDRVRDEVREKSRQWRNEILRKMPQPVIAKINGWVFGGGFTVVTGCDIAIAADDVQFGLSEVNFGHFPGGEVTIVGTGFPVGHTIRFAYRNVPKFDGAISPAVGATVNAQNQFKVTDPDVKCRTTIADRDTDFPNVLISAVDQQGTGSENAVTTVSPSIWVCP